MPGKTTVEITGQGIIVKNLKTSHAKLGDAFSQGLKLAGLALQAESQLLVPVEFGVLKGSAYTRALGKSWSTEVYIGYTAAYAAYVHEQVGMVLRGQQRVPSPPHIGRYWDPQGKAQAKFLEAPFRRFKPTAYKIIATTIKKAL